MPTSFSGQGKTLPERNNAQAIIQGNTVITVNMLKGIRQILATELNKSLLHVIFKISLNNDLYHSTPILKYKINIISGLDWMVGISDGVGNIVWGTRMDPVM